METPQHALGIVMVTHMSSAPRCPGALTSASEDSCTANTSATKAQCTQNQQDRHPGCQAEGFPTVAVELRTIKS